MWRQREPDPQGNVRLGHPVRTTAGSARALTASGGRQPARHQLNRSPILASSRQAGALAQQRQLPRSKDMRIRFAARSAT